MSQMPALLIGLPLFLASVLALIPKRNAAWVLLFITLLVLAVLALAIAAQVGLAGAVDYDMGNWAPPYGIAYRVDGLNALLLVLITAAALLFSPYLLPSALDGVVAPEKQSVFYALFLLCVVGLAGMVITHDIFNIYVFLEISSLASYALIASGAHRKAPAAGFEYLILGSVGATFFLIGIGFLYMATGTLNLTDLALLSRPLLEQNAQIMKVALAFLVIGLLLKMALFPLHFWLVQSYHYAPAPVAAFLAACSSKVALYVLIRIVYGIFGWPPLLGNMLQILAAGAVLFGSIAAFYQVEVRRALAFSSIAQMGLMVLAISLGTASGLAAALMLLLMHGPAKGALFLCAALVERQRGSSRVEDFSGIARMMPVMAAVFVVAAFSVVGVPLTAGFLGKWMLLSTLMQGGQWPLFVLVLCSSVLTLAYFFRLAEPMWFSTAVFEVKRKGQGPWYLLLPLVLLGCVCVYLGVRSTEVTDFVQQATLLYFRPGE